MKKIKQTAICFMLVFAMALMTTACTSKDSKPMETTMAPTTTSSTMSGTGTGPTDGMGSTESTGVIEGMEDALDMTTSPMDDTTAH